MERSAKGSLMLILIMNSWNCFGVRFLGKTNDKASPHQVNLIDHRATANFNFCLKQFVISGSSRKAEVLGGD